MSRSANSAFPQAIDREHDYVGAKGMTLREYFATRAPQPPAHWFRPAMPAVPTPPQKHPDLSGIALFEDFADDIGMVALGRRNFIYNTIDQWRRDPCYDSETIFTFPRDPDLAALLKAAQPAMLAHHALWVKYDQDFLAWTQEESRQFVAQWPWAWADLVLGAEEVTR